MLVDTPETNHAQLGKQPFGQQAKDRNTQLMNSGKLEIEFDIGERVDKYGRLLAYIYIDGVSIQEKLLEEGLARVGYVYPPNTRHLAAFEKAQDKAKKAGIGIWTLEDYVTERGFDSKKYPGDER
ncbi:thermonuclease family protein [Sporosarcina sp. YIM B06819]|uniref:thermonuclease family protein n=1 Tax=Sporosarcina sp. YIM B06819 TaxID=3081769 RepID=UPI00298D2882|nr:thermonuclease family protein [Sporosarcina sp. YIM B06819]